METQLQEGSGLNLETRETAFATAAQPVPEKFYRNVARTPKKPLVRVRGYRIGSALLCCLSDRSRITL
jgi:hypothetical protein